MTQTKPKNSIAWFEIPVTDLEKAKKFYGNVLQIGFQDMTEGPNPIAIFDVADMESTPAGHLYNGKPATDGTGPTVHLGVRDGLENGLARIKNEGGKVLSPAIEVPAGRFAYCLDPDGNSIAVFG